MTQSGLAYISHLVPPYILFFQVRQLPHPTSSTKRKLVNKMAMEQLSTSLPFVGGKKATIQHPLGPLTASEITESASLIKGLWPTNTNIQFKSITLQEPSKADLVPFLAAEHAGQQTPSVERRSFVIYYLRNTVSSQDY
jgi:Cu2+-containing amine oxidase